MSSNWKRAGSRATFPTTAIASATRATKASSSTAPSPMRCGTRARRQRTNRVCFAHVISKWPKISATAICPAGKRLYRNGANCNIGGRKAIKFTGAKRDCEKCPLRAQCLRHPQRTIIRQVAIFVGKHASAKEQASDRMKRKIDSERGREMITRRFATVEPVFGNVRGNKKMDRFTLRGTDKVDGQWKLYCLVQNIEKLAHYGYAR